MNRSFVQRLMRSSRNISISTHDVVKRSSAPTRSAAFARPQSLIVGMAFVLAGSGLWAAAQKDISFIKNEAATASAAVKKSIPRKRKVSTWNDLPQLIHNYGQRQAARALGVGTAPLTAGGSLAIGPRNFPLTEIDLTSGTTSDERDPVYRPLTGDFIAFASNGADVDKNGKLDAGVRGARYHIWLMRNDGTGARQLTGLSTTDSNRDQRYPSWSAEGTRLVYVDGATPALSQLAIIGNFTGGGQPTPQQITFFPGEKRTPSWSPAGNSIAFTCNVAPTVNNSGVSLGQFDIFTISPTGSTQTVRRLTGDADGRAAGAPTPSDPQDLIGNTVDDLAPAYSIVNPSVIYFSSNREQSGATAIKIGNSTGRRIWAMNANTGANKRQISVPTARTAGSSTDVDDRPTLSLRNITGFALQELVAFQSNSRVDDTDTTNDYNIWSLPVNSSTILSDITTPYEGSGTPPSPTIMATLETNKLSSPGLFRAAGFAGATEDKSNDVEPGFSRVTASRVGASRLAFASQRKSPAAPGTNSASPVPPIVNPGGGTGAGATHDIWTTAVRDVTPPILVPISVGNRQYPFLAPGPQAPFNAPRTAEEGLAPGGKLIVGLVLSEPESGLAAAAISIKDAERPNFVLARSDVNESKPVDAAVETPPSVIAGPYALTLSDNGPARVGGTERQANAIKGDGIYYCQISIDLNDSSGNPLNGDFYIDLNVGDNAGNTFTFDHVYGFSTRQFVQNNKLLFVSDYTVGQSFPGTLVSDIRSQFIGDPTESYFLTNPGGFVDGQNPVHLPFPFGPTNGAADPVTFREVDVWRILSRGEVPENIMALYAPQVVNQLNPNDEGVGAVPGPFTELSRRVTVAEQAILWASPYTGTVYAGPGTLFDAETQRRLTNYLSIGGRLFVTGQDVVFSLSNAGATTNRFLRDELRATWASETFENQFDWEIKGTTDPFIVNRTPVYLGGDRLDPPDNLQTPYHPTPSDTDSYYDAANNDFLPDIIGPVAAGDDETITPLYNYGGVGRAGHAIEKRNRGAGFDSRVVFFSFGMETVNREYTNNEKLQDCRNIRAKLAVNIANYLRTGRITGRVVNAVTNLPIPNFLVQVSPSGLTNIDTRYYLARTDANGVYEIAGMEARDRFYTVKPAVYHDPDDPLVARSLNPGFYANEDSPGFVFVVDVYGGRTTPLQDFRVFPSPPGTITGRAIDDRGTPFDVNDDKSPEVIVAPNLPVLLKSISTLPVSSDFPTGGKFAALTSTDASGRYIFDNVPSNTPYVIIFNPKPGFEEDGGDIPALSGIDYGTPTSKFQRNPNFGRRVIPEDDAYSGPYTGIDPIVAEVGNVVDLGDTPVPRAGQSISGSVQQGGRAVSGATVELVLNGNVVQTTKTAGAGTYTFADVQPGTYTVRATLGGASGSQTVVVVSGNNVSAPIIVLATATATPTPGGTPSATPSPSPGGTPGATPTPTSAPGEYVVGQLYQISLPYMNTNAANGVTTVAKAFTLPPTNRDGSVNYQLTRYNPLTQAYDATLTANSVVRRGEGYFLRPITNSVSQKTPILDRTLVPYSLGQYTFTLRIKPSVNNNVPNNGFNLIGFPFDPAKFRSLNWSQAKVTTPDGRTFASVSQAAAAGVMTSDLLTLGDNSSAYVSTTKMVPKRGYFARTFVDNLKVTVTGSTLP